MCVVLHSIKTTFSCCHSLLIEKIHLEIGILTKMLLGPHMQFKVIK